MATVDSGVLSKVSCIFDGSEKQIFHELLQNARRAEATHVTIRITVVDDVPEVTFSDNGKGVAPPSEEHPWSFLRYGGSGWRPNAEDEDPAGMGVFALSVFDEVNVLTVSHGQEAYRARISRDAFHGKSSIEFSPADSDDLDYVTGTQIKFAWAGDSLTTPELVSLKVAAMNAAEYCGIESVIVDTDGVGALRREDSFPAKSFVDPDHANCIFTEEYGDYTIGVYEKAVRSYSFYEKLNFAACFRGGLVGILPRLPEHYNELLDKTKNYEVRVDIKHLREGGLRMVLPARSDFKKDAAYAELLKRLRYLTLRLPVILKWETHSLPYTLFKEAEDVGICYPHLNLKNVLISAGYFESLLYEFVTQLSVLQAQKLGKKLVLFDGALPRYYNVAAAERCDVAFFHTRGPYGEYPEVKNLPTVDPNSVKTYVRWADELCYCKAGRAKEESDDAAPKTYLKLSLISVESGKAVHEVVLKNGHDWGGELTFDDLHVGFDLSDGERVTVRHNWAPVYWGDDLDLDDTWEPSLIVLSSATKHDDSTIDVMAEELATLSFSGSDDSESPPMEDQWLDHSTHVKALLIDNLQDYKKAMEYALRTALRNVYVGCYSEKIGWTVEQVFDAEGRRKLKITIGDKHA